MFSRDWSSDVCSSDLAPLRARPQLLEGCGARLVDRAPSLLDGERREAEVVPEGGPEVVGAADRDRKGVGWGKRGGGGAGWSRKETDMRQWSYARQKSR